MTPTEIAHEVERQLGYHVDGARFAELVFHATERDIRHYQLSGLLPGELTLADVLELLEHPGLARWREMRKVRCDYFLLFEAEIKSDDDLIDDYVALRQQFPHHRWRKRDPESEGIEPDEIELNVALYRICLERQTNSLHS